jgi:hypothetical protein
VHPDKPNEWCALELQAVYFSGAGMGSHLAQYHGASGLVFPDKQRRPDFRSQVSDAAESKIFGVGQITEVEGGARVK